MKILVCANQKSQNYIDAIESLSASCVFEYSPEVSAAIDAHQITSLDGLFMVCDLKGVCQCTAETIDVQGVQGCSTLRVTNKRVSVGVSKPEIPTLNHKGLALHAC